MNKRIIIPPETHQGEVKHLYAIIAYKQQGQEKLLIAQTGKGEVRCVSVDKAEINRMFDTILQSTPRDITLVLSKFSLREDQVVRQGSRMIV